MLSGLGELNLKGHKPYSTSRVRGCCQCTSLGFRDSSPLLKESQCLVEENHASNRITATLCPLFLWFLRFCWLSSGVFTVLLAFIRRLVYTGAWATWIDGGGALAFQGVEYGFQP